VEFLHEEEGGVDKPNDDIHKKLKAEDSSKVKFI
jgi:hypothetical protein